MPEVSLRSMTHEESDYARVSDWLALQQRTKGANQVFRLSLFIKMSQVSFVEVRYEMLAYILKPNEPLIRANSERDPG